MPAIRVYEPANRDSTTNEELLQLAGQRGSIRLKLKWSIYIPIRRERTPRRYRGEYGWQYTTLKDMSVHFDVLSPATVWKIIRGCAALIRELTK